MDYPSNVPLRVDSSPLYRPNHDMHLNLATSSRADYIPHSVQSSSPQQSAIFSAASSTANFIPNIHTAAPPSNDKSPHSPSTSGVPQGTVMGPDGVLRRRRKRVRHAKNPMGEPERYCQVCGDKAINFNYGVISCESCKAFFRRNAFRLSDLVCVRSEVQAGTLCTIDKQSRKNCSACRLRKCFSLGMRREWEEIDIGKTGVGEQSKASPPVHHTNDVISPQLVETNDLLHSLPSVQPVTPEVPKSMEKLPKELPLRILHMIDIENIQPMTGDHLTHITMVTLAYDELWIKAKFPDMLLNVRNLENPKDVFIIVECIIRMTIAFLKKVPEFSALTMEEKKRLLGVRLFPILAINSLMQLDLEKGTVVLMTNSGPFYFDAKYMLSENMIPDQTEMMDILREHTAHLTNCRDIIGLSKSLAAIILIMKVLEPEPMTLFACSDSNEYDMESMSRRKYAYQFYATFFARYLRHIYPLDYAERWQRFLVWYDYSVQKFDHHAMTLCQMITSAGVSDADLPVVLDICSYVRSGMANSFSGENS